MRNPDATARTANLAAAATTLLALMAMAAGGPAGRATAAGRIARAEIVLSRSDWPAVRAVAAAVAAARDLLVGRPARAALPAPAAPDLAPARTASAGPQPCGPWRPPRRLAERLLDLPPPTG